MNPSFTKDILTDRSWTMNGSNDFSQKHTNNFIYTNNNSLCHMNENIRNDFISYLICKLYVILQSISISIMRLYDQFGNWKELVLNFSFHFTEEPNTPNNIFLISFGVTLLPYHKTSQFASRAFSKKSFTILNDKQTANFSTTSSFVYTNITIKNEEKKSVLSLKRLDWEADSPLQNIYKWGRFFVVSKWTLSYEINVLYQFSYQNFR